MQQGLEALVRARTERKVVPSARARARRRQPQRSELPLSHLMERRSVSELLMNVKVPAETVDAIDQIAAHCDASKTEVVLALLTEGLQATASIMKRAAVAALLLLVCVPAARAVVFGEFFVHGKGFKGLADPGYAYDSWSAGEFMNQAKGCSGMPTGYSHVDGTRGLYAAFNTYDCGCGSISYFGCTFLIKPNDGSPDPGYVPPSGCGGVSVPRYYKLKDQGVIEQIAAFIDQSGVTDLTVVTAQHG